ncbi:KAP family P-loop NTPase fold protein [Vibrio tasmaniensis]|uniref:KAP family P-loop NTPase fold protein n=1 Tax=Vibrio tasmaniensis TaxID=212663 RepID=UPI00107F4A1E|nr:P-loop NTPase fold protein [Vibrio tasmaniensis]
MRLTLPIFDFTDNNGFNSGIDIFGRKRFGEQVTNLILNTEENLVLALDSNWGQGKSTFIRMWKDHNNLLEVPLTTIYFDAFENDYQQDAFLALASEVYNALQLDVETDKEEFKNKVFNVAKAFGRSAIRIGSRVATAGLIDDTILDAAQDELSKSISDNVESYISHKLDNTDQDRLALKEFRDFLSTVIQEKMANKKLVFVIDELDRCRPDFALEIIEKIKHLFSVEGLTFLLVMNRTQLEESVKCKYGSGIEAQTYLQKFIHIWLQLPENRNQDFGQSDKIKFLNYAVREMDCDFLAVNDVTKKTLLEVIAANNTSFREIERMMTQIAIIQNIETHTSQYNFNYQLAVAGLIFIKVNLPDLYLGLVTKKIDPDMLLRRLNIKQENGTYAGSLANIILATLCDDATFEQMLESGQIQTETHRPFDRDVFVSLHNVVNNFGQI